MNTKETDKTINRLREEIDAKYQKKKDLADIVEVDASVISRLLGNGKYNAETRKKLVKAGIDMDYVETGVRKTAALNEERVIYKPEDIPNNGVKQPAFESNVVKGLHKLELITIPLFLSPAANAGRGIDFMDRQNIGTMLIPNILVRADRESYGVYTSGDSMQDAGITDGCQLVVEVTTDEAELNGEVVVATINGLTVVKRFILERGKRIFRSEGANGSHYDDIVIHHDTMYQIHGLVAATFNTSFRKGKRR